jgi:high-affinity iron transporter
MASGDLWDAAIATLFAREFLEGSIIIGQYRTVLLRSPDWQDEEKKKQGLRAINRAALGAGVFAFVLCMCVGTSLALLSKGLDQRVGKVIEGVSKVVAAIWILQLSAMIPTLLGVYASKKHAEDVKVGLTIKSIRYNIAWNIWREVGEIGVFLIPFFLNKDAILAIPVSAIVGIVIGLLAGYGIYVANKKMENKSKLAYFMVLLLVFLSVGLFVGGCHEFELVWGQTRKVWEIKGQFWSHTQLPMTLIKPFGYSASRTVLQICCFWLWLALAGGLHFYKYTQSQKIFQQRQAERAKNLRREGTSSSTSDDLEMGSDVSQGEA